VEWFHLDVPCTCICLSPPPVPRAPRAPFPAFEATTMSAWLSLLCGVLVLVAAAYLLYVVLRPETF